MTVVAVLALLSLLLPSSLEDDCRSLSWMKGISSSTSEASFAQFSVSLAASPASGVDQVLFLPDSLPSNLRHSMIASNRLEGSLANQSEMMPISLQLAQSDG